MPNETYKLQDVSALKNKQIKIKVTYNRKGKIERTEIIQR